MIFAVLQKSRKVGEVGMTPVEAYWAGYQAGKLSMPEIVRCKDCKHYRHYGLSHETVSECTIGHEENPDENWFCADGERSE